VRARGPALGETGITVDAELRAGKSTDVEIRLPK
jgi:hypothetical protein